MTLDGTSDAARRLGLRESSPTISFKLVRTLVEFPELAFLITGRSEKILRPGG